MVTNAHNKGGNILRHIKEISKLFLSNLNSSGGMTHTATGVICMPKRENMIMRIMPKLTKIFRSNFESSREMTTRGYYIHFAIGAIVTLCNNIYNHTPSIIFFKDNMKLHKNSILFCFKFFLLIEYIFRREIG